MRTLATKPVYQSFWSSRESKFLDTDMDALALALALNLINILRLARLERTAPHARPACRAERPSQLHRSIDLLFDSIQFDSIQFTSIAFLRSFHRSSPHLPNYVTCPWVDYVQFHRVGGAHQQCLQHTVRTSTRLWSAPRTHLQSDALPSIAMDHPRAFA